MIGDIHFNAFLILLSLPQGFEGMHCEVCLTDRSEREYSQIDSHCSIELLYNICSQWLHDPSCESFPSITNLLCGILAKKYKCYAALHISLLLKFCIQVSLHPDVQRNHLSGGVSFSSYESDLIKTIEHCRHVS